MNEKEVLTVKEVAKLLRVSEVHVRVLAKRGDFGDAVMRLGAAYRFRANKIKKYLYGKDQK